MKFIKRKGTVALAVILAFQGVNLVPAKVHASGNNTKYGFKVISKKYIGSIKSTAIQYEHVKSGARVLYLKNNDPNKTFAINFRTLPSDNTGTNHILEHCLLDGSKKYPVNNALTNMANQSLSGQYNAFTGSDMTKYYFSASNDKDFTNFLSVMLDGIFKPNLLNNRNIFLQEGGHYELNKNKSKAVYNGVVYNEIGGRSSNTADVDNIISSKSMESVIPHTIYSG